MTVKQAPRKRRFYTIEEANSALPLLRSILRDVTALAHDLQERHQRLLRLQSTGSVDRAHQEELQSLAAEFDRDQERMKEFENELRSLNVELKDYFTGLVDFRSRMDGREVYLCWRLGEPDVSHWHELDAGFSGRQKLHDEVLS